MELANVRATLGSESPQHFTVSIARQHGTVAMDPLR